ncbi:hypothetical protein KXQ82_09150 [Mucilaginibacter sp. HMF5004]|uniref:hypothetical protein n=1 Tax=Mucilaginibacter rivuli TaxID=2857527 RepID=UPI001C5F28EE|nr:hypothetical protein [Mucilaginibacter rivuli]MBW4889882.1 hypothetical protein [Mucilaginibacter rivuli]
MEKNTNVVYLPIRSLGDFVITSFVIKNFIDKSIPISLPFYISEIYEAIDGDSLFNVIDKLEIQNQPAFFELYKIKDKKNVIRLFKDIVNIFFSLKPESIYLLDFRSRRLFFSRSKFRWPADNINIYDAKRKFFTSYFGLTYNPEADILIEQNQKINRIIIFPDSRIKDKEIPGILINEIVKNFPEIEINTANFTIEKLPGTLNYSNFTQIIDLIKSADFIISSDSLPCHLANFYNVRHFVIYMKGSKFYTDKFQTPFMIKHNYFSITDDINFEPTITKLKQIFS